MEVLRQIGRTSREQERRTRANKRGCVEISVKEITMNLGESKAELVSVIES
jgi:hypothetical protein